MAPVALDPPPTMPGPLSGAAGQPPLVIADCTWEQYLAMDALFADSGLRLRFLDSSLEIMLPVSLPHERRKSHLGCLIETWCLEREIEFFINGETTLKKEREAGGEPDESYMFHAEKDRPDLALEVASTSGGLSKRAFYRKFEIPEIWIWRIDRLEVHLFSPETREYLVSPDSAMLPGIPLADVAECARFESASQAIREFQKRIRA